MLKCVYIRREVVRIHFQIMSILFKAKCNVLKCHKCMYKNMAPNIHRQFKTRSFCMDLYLKAQELI